MTVTIYSTLRVGEASVMLVAAPDASRQQRALAHAHGYAVSYLDTAPPEVIHERLGALKRSIESLGGAEIGERAALERIARACAAAIPGSRLQVRRRLPSDQRVPRWPVSLRSGLPGRGAIWPYDTELVGLLIGRRRLLLREAASGEPIEAAASLLSGHGAAVRVVSRGGGAPPLLFAALDEAVLDEATGQHAASCAGDDRFLEAARWMGEALGYPGCCVEAFVKARAREDVILLAERLPPLPHPPASPLLAWMSGAVGLLSHVPCSQTCERSRQLAEAVLAAIDEQSAGFAERWLSLARRVHAITAEGRCYVIDAEGDLVSGGEATVREASELVPPEGPDLTQVARPAPSLAGRLLRVEGGMLVDPAGGFTAALVADHRG